MQGQGSSAPKWCSCPLGAFLASRVVQAKVSPYLCFAWGILPELYSNLRWLLLVLGLEIPK